MYALDPAINYAVPVNSNSPVTRGGEVYDVLRAELLNGLLNPGDKLRMVELAARFSVSQSVVREGLTRLAEQGLVVATPQRGFRVRELSVEDIVGLTESRVEIESVALRLAIERGDVRWETEIVAAHHLLERTPVVDADGRFHEPWAPAHHDFHRALTAGCNNARLQGVVLALRDSAELYRRWWWALADDHQRDLTAEHRQLKDLTLARDADGAIEALTYHIKGAPERLIAYAREHGLDDLNTPPPTESPRTKRPGRRRSRK
jgi:DNA-binding GntR family transcriptional regulator